MRLCDKCFEAAGLRAKQLKKATANAITAAEDAQVEGAINWGSLYCVEAWVMIEAQAGMSGSVLIEEAAPDNYEFQKFIIGYLSERGFRDVGVRTEW